MRAACRRVVLVLLFAAGSAAGHTRSQSHSVWEINATAVDLVMTIPTIETDRIGDGAAAPSDDRIKSYLTARVYPIAAGRRCALIPPVETLAALPGYHKYDFTFKCDTAEDLQIYSAAFFDLVPSHTNFAQIQNAATGEFTEQLITNEHRTVDVTGRSGSRLKNARFFEFIRMGTMHIFTGADHMSFLLGLVLISRRLRDLVFVITGFTIGHSLTLALAVTGILRPHAEYIDALVALTIALIGAENIVVQTHKAKPVGLIAGGCMAAMAAAEWLGLGGLPGLLSLGAGLFTANYLVISGSLGDAGRLRMLITLGLQSRRRDRPVDPGLRSNAAGGAAAKAPARAAAPHRGRRRVGISRGPWRVLVCQPELRLKPPELVVSLPSITVTGTGHPVLQSQRFDEANESRGTFNRTSKPGRGCGLMRKRPNPSEILASISILSARFLALIMQRSDHRRRESVRCWVASINPLILKPQESFRFAFRHLFAREIPRAVIVTDLPRRSHRIPDVMRIVHWRLNSASAIRARR